MRTSHPRLRRNLRQRENAARCTRKAATATRCLQRFSVSIAEEAEEAALSEKCVPKNTATALSGLCVTSNVDAKGLTKTFNLELEPESRLSFVAVLCKSLSMYVAEVRKQDGSPCPPKSLYMLLTGLLLYCL